MIIGHFYLPYVMIDLDIKKDAITASWFCYFLILKEVDIKKRPLNGSFKIYYLLLETVITL